MKYSTSDITLRSRRSAAMSRRVCGTLPQRSIDPRTPMSLLAAILPAAFILLLAGCAPTLLPDNGGSAPGLTIDLTGPLFDNADDARLNGRNDADPEGRSDAALAYPTERGHPYVETVVLAAILRTQPIGPTPYVNADQISNGIRAQLLRELQYFPQHAMVRRLPGESVFVLPTPPQLYRDAWQIIAMGVTKAIPDTVATSGPAAADRGEITDRDEAIAFIADLEADDILWMGFDRFFMRRYLRTPRTGTTAVKLNPLCSTDSVLQACGNPWFFELDDRGNPTRPINASQQTGADPYATVPANIPSGAQIATVYARTVADTTIAYTIDPPNTRFAIDATGTITRTNQGTLTADRSITLTVTATVDNGRQASASITIGVTATVGVAISQSALTLPEGATATYTVQLTTQPTDDVVITTTSTNTGEATVALESLTFTDANWNTPQTVTVTAVNDNTLGNASVAINHAIDPTATADVTYAALTDLASVTVTVTDDDTAGVTIAQSGTPTPDTAVTEGATGEDAGARDTYTVVLDSQPAGNVVIAVTNGDSGAITVSRASLTFTTGNWNTAQTVTVTPVDDADVTDESVTITHAVTTAAGVAYPTSLSIASVTVTVTDDDTAGVTIAQSGTPTPDTAVTEGATGEDAGARDTYTVVLDSQPAGNVVIAVTNGDSGAITVSRASLTFTTGNWNTAQTVTVTPVDDADVTDESVTITHAVTTAAGVAYPTSLSIASVTVTVTDDDTPSIMVGVTELTPPVE